ncbi:lysine N(6)-hydroxylase/L-ornithine N(5)-oxygenase family protein [Streptomyces sp. NBC_00441]|uniref:SidA/IucD/PvdA family monooxygenase n=1 Tax=Streptomyces sp. NBC_00441 TaxID=2975742 RepID=UPI002E2AFF31|nr:SidA/IucD/PvdA family monooxygenase [Streptomyces sp. NBC_00441]
MTPPTDYDVVGVGFGPSNLSLACAIQEWNENADSPRRLRALFLESGSRFGWYPDLLLPAAKCQVVYAKDLATTRDPRSRFSFLNHLHLRGRLHEFFDVGDPVPTRQEFHSYFEWAAAEVAPMVSYGSRALAVTPVRDAGTGRADALTVRVADGSGERTVSTRTVVAAIGGSPVLPPSVTARPGGRVFHAGEFLSAFRRHCPDPGGAYTVAVVGSGQSAADIVLYLLSEYPGVRVEWLTRSYALRAVDANPFVNAFFRPGTIDVFHALPEDARTRLNNEFYSTGYGIVDPGTLQELHRFTYQEGLHGRSRLAQRPLTEVTSAAEEGGSVRLGLRDEDGTESLACDVAVMATGYVRTTSGELFAPLADLVKRDDRGELRLRRDYSVDGLDDAAQVYLQGFAARSHGIGDEALSNVATRAGEILRALVAGAPGG